MANFRREPKLAGRHKLTTIRLLAEGETQANIARRMDTTPEAVSQFADRYAAEIAEVKANFTDEWAGMWVAKKRARLAELQQIFEDTAEALNEENDEGERTYEGSFSEAQRVKMAALRAAAEELGQLVTKADLTARQEVKYSVHVEGASEGDLT